MVTRRDYASDAVAACESVLVEIVHVLGEFRRHMVIVGGWVPSLLVKGASEPHLGTLDIDVALDFRRIPEDTYQTLLGALIRRGYRQDPEQPFRFFRPVRLTTGESIEVEVDLLAGEYGGTTPGHRTQQVQDARARKSRGCDLAFGDHVRVILRGHLPDGSRDEVTFQVAGPASFLAMKGMALQGRLKEKDAYDIYYVVRHYPGGAATLVRAIRPYVGNKLAREGLGKVRAKFGSPEDVGPSSVADFLEISDPDERAIRMRDAYEVISRLLDELGILPWVGL